MSTGRLGYYLRETFLTFMQHHRLHSVAIFVMSIAVAILALFLLLMLNANRLLTSLGAQAQVIVFLNDDIQPSQHQAIEDVLKQAAQGQAVRYISKAQAWEDFASWYPDSHHLLEGLGPASLPASLILQLPEDAHSEAMLMTLQQRLAHLPGIDEVEYGAKWREGFRKLLRGVWYVSLVGGVLLGLGMLLIMANTTRLALYTHLHDIEIMQLVGATDRFIGWPFVLTGIIQGLLSALFGLGFLLGIYQIVRNSLSPLLADILGSRTLHFLPWPVVLGIVISSFAVGYLGSTLTLQRMLRILRVTS